MNIAMIIFSPDFLRTLFSSMKNILILSGIGFVLILTVILFFVIRSAVKRHHREREILSTIKRLIGQTGDTYHIIDIRENDAYQQSHIPTSVNVPFSEIADFFPTEKMFSRIIVCGEKFPEVKKAARDLSDRAYFRVDTLFKLAQWDGEWETGKGRTRVDIEGERLNEDKQIQ